ncbi:MAG: hypothetical protein ABIP94_06910 [Planctomycetota bacterium]
MRPSPSLCLLLAIAPLLTAQVPAPTPNNPLLAAKARLAAALQKTGNLHDAAFTASWAPDKKNKGADNPFAAFGASNTAKVAGSWHEGLWHYQFDGDPNDEVLVAGHRTIARDDNIGWKVRPNRYADGNSADFLPDVPLLLQQLAAWELAVVQTGVDSFDDRPVEIVSVTLTADQVAEAVWSGLLPEALVQGEFAMQFFAVGGRAARTAAIPPTATVDLAISIDPATSLVQQVRVRGWNKQDAGGRAGVLVVRAGGVVGAGKDEEEDEVEDVKPDAPLTFEMGLPVHPRKKMSVMDYTVRISEHGTKQAPVLSDVQKKLLRR